MKNCSNNDLSGEESVAVIDPNMLTDQSIKLPALKYDQKKIITITGKDVHHTNTKYQYETKVMVEAKELISLINTIKSLWIQFKEKMWPMTVCCVSYYL